jgi:hypothetical protein
VAEAGDAGIALAVIAAGTDGRAPHQLDPVAGRILEGDEVADLAKVALLLRAGADLMAEPLQLGGGVLEIGAAADLERRGLVLRRAFEIAQRVFALVGLEIDGVLAAVRNLKAEIIGGEFGRAVEVPRSEPCV